MSLLPREQAHAVTAPAPRFDPHERPHGARDSRAYRAREAVHQHPEIDCVRSLLSPGIAEAAEHRADRIGVGADRVLIAAGSLSEDRYVTALAAHLGIPFEPLETVPRHACMLADERLPAAAAAGLLPLRLSSDFVWVVAPRGVAARRLIGLVRLHPVLRERLRLTTAARITRFANQHGSRSVGLLAADGLRTAKPQFSAATRSRFHPLLLAAAAIGICAAIAPVISVAVLDAALATLFLGCILMRFAAAALRVKPTRVEPVHDQSLPTYTIIVALYREARAVPGLVHALKQLDYPALGSKCTKVRILTGVELAQVTTLEGTPMLRPWLEVSRS